ncbi:flavin-containing monooxygenase [Paraconexibacter sp.]|uniref:flavin-containing monooxygenase n=1 Tax=Paraconexibacter sp. TaxID=2949640 RepID=UPI003565A90F
MTTAVQPDHEAVVIGGGFSGIGAAIRLKEAGIGYQVIEEADDVGGTWHWNTYPGVAVDIPSFSYQFSFERRTDWSRVYAPGTELRGYALDLVEKYDLRRHIRFGTRVLGATFDEDAHLWRLETSAGDEVTARFVVTATGVLTIPKPPEIEGVEDFAGPTVHTARWNHDLDLRGKRVAVIGTGASAVQLIPELAKEVSHLTVFQRTPIWCLPKLDGPMPGAVRWLMKKVPGGDLAARLASQAFVEVTFPLAAHYSGVVPFGKLGEKLARKALQEVEDPEVREKLTPKYAVGCKRPSFHNSYLQTFNLEHVLLETEPIARITPTGVVTDAGVVHEIDVLVLATGFKVFESGNMPPFRVTGVDGVDLEAWWDENRFQAYEGVSVPGFPNMFTVLGPYGYNGSSYFNLIETQTRHILRCLERARREDATFIEVKREANDRYFRSMLARRGQQIFWQDSCAVANSYYFDKHGDVPFRPAPTIETTWRSMRFDLDDYRFATLADGGGAGGSDRSRGTVAA